MPLNRWSRVGVQRATYLRERFMERLNRFMSNVMRLCIHLWCGKRARRVGEPIIACFSARL